MKKILLGILLALVVLVSACETTETKPVNTAVQVEQVQQVKEVKVEPLEPRVHKVKIESFAFVPAELTVNVGDTVVWTNEDRVVHTATALDGSFDTNRIGNDQSKEVAFTQVGEYAYKCNIHPSMKGLIIVQ
ncbi:cupredoxin family copper-binding protein [archaeon]|nr:cupredoxin family copper-binding protein [archaeon]